MDDTASERNYGHNFVKEQISLLDYKSNIMYNGNSLFMKSTYFRKVMTFMRPSTRKKRDYVIAVALRLFSEKGFDNVSVDEIIAATNTSKGTFYHYFQSKEEIVREIYSIQCEIIDRWRSQPPSAVMSLEGHINQLFLDLSSNLVPYRKLVRSLLSTSFMNLALQSDDEQLSQYLLVNLLYWFPDRQKAELLVSVYFGTLFNWCSEEDSDLPTMMRSNLTYIWTGLRETGTVQPIQFTTSGKEESKMKVAIIGGGLAGLTAAAYLSEEPSIEGVLFERNAHLGGRAFTYEKSQFTLNYGAHAIYGIDRHTITKIEKELGLSFSSKQVDKRNVMYAKNDRLTPAPLDFVNIVRTELLDTMQKMRFVGEVSAMIAQIHTLKNFPTLGDYIAESNSDDDVKELWEHLVCSNFFISPEDARKVPGHVISDYYQNLFLSSRPVNYILGSWAVITNQLQQKTELSGRWEIARKEPVDTIRYANGKFMLTTKQREAAFDRVIFATPVQQVVQLLSGTPWEPFLAEYEHNTPTEVLVYDVGFDSIVARPFSYISDMDKKMFITDVSATDHTLVPQGGQLLQGIAYLSDDFTNEEDRKQFLDNKMQQMEQLFDQYYPGWRDHIAVRRMSKKAMVSSVKNIATNKLLPNRIENVPFYFCGDGCTGKGELAERAFSSARQTAKMILASLER